MFQKQKETFIINSRFHSTGNDKCFYHIRKQAYAGNATFMQQNVLNVAIQFNKYKSSRNCKYVGYNNLQDQCKPDF